MAIRKRFTPKERKPPIPPADAWLWNGEQLAMWLEGRAAEIKSKGEPTGYRFTEYTALLNSAQRLRSQSRNNPHDRPFEEPPQG